MRRGIAMSVRLAVLGCALCLSGCSSRPDAEAAKQEILAADRSFSAMSVAGGMAAAFAHYAAADAVIYRDGQHPITGRESIRSLMAANGQAILRWEPISVEIAASGDLGYTRGRYIYTVPNPEGVASESHGYYVTIWRKEPTGSWKYVFDTGVQAPVNTP